MKEGWLPPPSILELHIHQTTQKTHTTIAAAKPSGIDKNRFENSEDKNLKTTFIPPLPFLGNLSIRPRGKCDIICLRYISTFGSTSQGCSQNQDFVVTLGNRLQQNQNMNLEYLEYYQNFYIEVRFQLWLLSNSKPCHKIEDRQNQNVNFE